MKKSVDQNLYVVGYKLQVLDTRVNTLNVKLLRHFQDMLNLIDLCPKWFVSSKFTF
jgi:hypothetical protein